jgi:hypothetical protein
MYNIITHHNIYYIIISNCADIIQCHNSMIMIHVLVLLPVYALSCYLMYCAMHNIHHKSLRIWKTTSMSTSDVLLFQAREESVHFPRQLFGVKRQRSNTLGMLAVVGIVLNAPSFFFHEDQNQTRDLFHDQIQQRLWDHRVEIEVHDHAAPRGGDADRLDHNLECAKLHPAGHPALWLRNHETWPLGNRFAVEGQQEREREFGGESEG